MNYEYYMEKALEVAKAGYDLNEIPVGAVVVDKEGIIIGSGCNRRESSKNAIMHAEMIAINEACEKLGGWRLPDCSIYVTFEPCLMCWGAIVNSRISKLVYGARDLRFGILSGEKSVLDLPSNFRPEIVAGVMEKECAGLLSDFFTLLRKGKQQPTQS